jgi:hypothetical protein
LPNLFHSSVRKTAIILGILVATSRIAPAQAVESGQRGAEIAPFAQYTLLTPDWGPTNNVGFAAGVDYTRFIRSIVQPSLELRVTNATGSTVSEHTYSGGLKLQTTIHRIHPYFTILGGKGFIDFTHPINGYISDSSFVFAYGGGAILPVRSNIDVRLDFSRQQWNIDPQTLTPTAFGVGIAYRIPFHNGRTE